MRGVWRRRKASRASGILHDDEAGNLLRNVCDHILGHRLAHQRQEIRVMHGLREERGTAATLGMARHD